MTNENRQRKTFPRIVFMGSPEFAVASLDALLQAGYPIVAVITAPDKPAGRGLQLSETAVKQYALRNQLPVLQPEILKNPEYLKELKELRADLQVVVAFRMLPEQVWNMPPLGTINLHGSLLPQYRGAAPINWAIIHGEHMTGVTTFRLKQEIDTGNILMQEMIPIGDNETAGELHDRMKKIGAALLVKTIDGLLSGDLKEIPQSQEQIKEIILHPAPKIFSENCRINWSKPAAEIHNMIRGLSPFPAAFTQLDHQVLKIFRSAVEKATPAEEPGSYITDGKTFLKFACADGYVKLLEIQLQGKKKMQIADFLRGYRFGKIQPPDPI